MEQDNKKWSIHSLLMGAMLVAIIVQSFVIFNMQKKLDHHPGIDQENTVTQLTHGFGGRTNSSSQLSGSPDEDKDFFFRDMDDWDPFEEMQSMQDHMNQMFGSTFNRFRYNDNFGKLFEKHAFSPNVDLEDKGDHYLVTVDVPGIEDSKLDIKVENQKLTISGSVQSDSREEKKGKMLRHERRSGRFQRSVTLPGPVQADKVDVTNKTGVVYISIPKAKE